jgi:hypothetical protein
MHCGDVCTVVMYVLWCMVQVTTLRTSEPKLVEMITTADDKSMQPLLELNDLLQGALSEYEHVCKHGPRSKGPAPVPAPRAGTAAAAPAAGPVTPKVPGRCHASRMT